MTHKCYKLADDDCPSLQDCYAKPQYSGGATQRRQAHHVNGSHPFAHPYIHHERQTNKGMFVGVYLDKDRVSDTPQSAETGISEIL